MGRLKTLARAAGAAVAFLLYVWFEAVLSVGAVKRRRAARRVAIRRAAARAGARHRGG